MTVARGMIAHAHFFFAERVTPGARPIIRGEAVVIERLDRDRVVAREIQHHQLAELVELAQRPRRARAPELDADRVERLRECRGADFAREQAIERDRDATHFEAGRDVYPPALG